jgi:hypothetical protein
MGRRITVLSESMGHMRPTPWWGLWIGLLSLYSLVSLSHSLGAEETSLERLEEEAFCLVRPSRCPPGAAPTTADDLRTRDEQTLQPAASAPPEDPLASDCRFLALQTEWVASKRDAGIPLVEALTSFRRVFARDMPGQDAISGALGTMVYRDPQRSPAELRQAMEAECLAHPLRWTDRRLDW